MGGRSWPCWAWHCLSETLSCYRCLLAILFCLLCRLLEDISKALERHCLSFYREHGAVLAFLELCYNSGVSSCPFVLLSLMSLRRTLRKDSSGGTGEVQARLGSRVLLLISTCLEVQEQGAISDSVSTRQPCATEGGWWEVRSWLRGLGWLHWWRPAFGCFFSWSWGWALSEVLLCLGVPSTQGLYVGLMEEGSGLSFPTSRTLFHRKFCISFRSQLEKFMSGIKKKSFRRYIGYNLGLFNELKQKLMWRHVSTYFHGQSFPVWRSVRKCCVDYFSSFLVAKWIPSYPKFC